MNLRTARALVGLLLPLAASAQIQTPSFAVNDFTVAVSTSITGYGFAGPNTTAWQITPTTSTPGQSAQVFTRNNTLSGSIYMTLEIWTDNAGLPGIRLAGGSWKIVNARPFAWQGTDLDGVIALTANTPYWVVWIDPGFSTPPVEPGGATVLTRATRSGSTWTRSATAEAPKLRLFSGQLSDLYSSPSGFGCYTVAGQRPAVFTNELSTLGNAGFFFEATGFAPGAAVFFLVGLLPSWPTVPVPGLPVGCVQNTDAAFTSLAFAGTGNVRGPTCAGYVSLPLALPAASSYLGLTLACQAATPDPASSAALPFATSQAQRVTIY